MRRGKVCCRDLKSFENDSTVEQYHTCFRLFFEDCWTCAELLKPQPSESFVWRRGRFTRPRFREHHTRSWSFSCTAPALSHVRVVIFAARANAFLGTHLGRGLIRSQNLSDRPARQIRADRSARLPNPSRPVRSLYPSGPIHSAKPIGLVRSPNPSGPVRSPSGPVRLPNPSGPVRSPKPSGPFRSPNPSGPPPICSPPRSFPLLFGR